jgi:hypothetical protein
VSDAVGVTPPVGRIVVRGQTSPVVAHLPFADHEHKLDAAQNDSRTTKVLEALEWARDALDCTVISLDDVVQVLALPNHDFGAVLIYSGLGRMMHCIGST